MDKTHEMRTGGGPKGIFEKIRRSLARSPAVPPVHGVSYVQQDPMPASTALMLSPSKTNVSENKRGKGVAPVDFHHSAFAKQNDGHIIVEGIMKAEVKAGQGHGDQFLGKNSESDDKFSEYIHRAKQKITRTSSDVVGAGAVARLESVNKKASAYIDGTRRRIRNSATFGAGTK